MRGNGMPGRTLRAAALFTPARRLRRVGCRVARVPGSSAGDGACRHQAAGVQVPVAVDKMWQHVCVQHECAVLAAPHAALWAACIQQHLALRGQRNGRAEHSLERRQVALQGRKVPAHKVVRGLGVAQAEGKQGLAGRRQRQLVLKARVVTACTTTG
eukprot:361095-Chlamydomonas_euryale.AAC.4